MFGYSLVVGVILVTGAYAIPVGNQDVDSAFLRRPSLEDELRDLPYEDLPKVEDDGIAHDASLNPAEETRVSADTDIRQMPASGVVSAMPAVPLHSHLIDIDSNVHQLSSSSAAEATASSVDTNEREWRPEDDEKDDEDDVNDSSPDDEADDDDEEDDETDETNRTNRPPTGDVINGDPGQYTPATNDDAAKGEVAMSVEKKSTADQEKRALPRSRQPPAYIREAYFLAKEDKTDTSAGGVRDEQQSSATPDQTPPASYKSSAGMAKAVDPIPTNRQTSRVNPIDGSSGQKEQFAEVVVKLASAEDDGHPHHRDDATAVKTADITTTVGEHDVNGNDDENNNNGGEAEPTSATQHQRRMGDPEVSHGNNQNHENRGLIPTVTEDTEEPVAMAVAAAPATTTITTTEEALDQTAVSDSENSGHDNNDDNNDDDDQQQSGVEDVDELESELEAEEGRIKDEISERERSIGAGKRLVKKVVPMDTQKIENAAEKDESANEDILELIIKVAERPSSWKEIKELLEKIQYEENTLNKAKARLRALAKQKQMKNRKEQRNKENKIGKNRNKYNPNKNLHNGTQPNKEHNFNRAEITPGEQPKAGGGHRITINADSQHHNNRHHQMGQQPAMARVPLLRNNNNNDDIIKAAVFPSATGARHTAHSDDNGKHPQHVKQHHGGRRPSGGSSDEHDFAIENPVTVIGERSRIDPVEKELIEASTNQRLREIQIEKARLAAIPEPTDEMERQLKALTKMERRLKEHWRQKQKLIQKIRETNEEHAKW